MDGASSSTLSLTRLRDVTEKRMGEEGAGEWGRVT